MPRHRPAGIIAAAVVLAAVAWADTSRAAETSKYAIQLEATSLRGTGGIANFMRWHLKTRKGIPATIIRPLSAGTITIQTTAKGAGLLESWKRVQSVNIEPAKSAPASQAQPQSPGIHFQKSPYGGRYIPPDVAGRVYRR